MKHLIIYYEIGYYVINLIKVQLIKCYSWYLDFQEQAETTYPHINAHPENNKSISLTSLYKLMGKEGKSLIHLHAINASLNRQKCNAFLKPIYKNGSH